MRRKDVRVTYFCTEVCEFHFNVNVNTIFI